MDDFIDVLIRLLEQIEANFDELTDEDANALSELLIESMTFLKESYQSKEVIESNLETPTPQGADLLWILSNGDVNAFVNYLRTYPGEGFQELAANPTQLANVIAKLQQQNPGQEPGIGPEGIPNTQFPSSNVAGMKYDPQSNKLLVKFHGEHGEPIYQYDGVPPQIFQLLQHGNAFAKTKGKNRWGEWWPMKNPSIGASVNQYLKAGGYAYQRIK